MWTVYAGPSSVHVSALSGEQVAGRTSRAQRGPELGARSITCLVMEAQGGWPGCDGPREPQMEGTGLHSRASQQGWGHRHGPALCSAR